MRSRGALLVTAALVLSAGAAEAGDPTRRWHTVETEHFVIHYYEPLGEVAERVAVVAERAHRTLTPALGHAPAEKTQVVVIDDTDGANGFASVLPRNRITLFATAPIGESALNDHDDWLYTLVAHEYTHILHLDTIGGLPEVVNKVLGKTWAPNQIQPRWIIEGLATYEESKRSSAGRTRSNTFDMFVRTAVLEGEELGLDEVTNGPYEFPRGNAAYLYGSKFLQYVFDREGDDRAREMSWASGQHPIPYAVNRQIHAVTGEPFTALWADWKAWLRDRYTLQLEAVERAGVRAGRRLTFDTESHLSPQYSADGEVLLWLANDGVSRPRIRALPVGGNVGDARDVLPLDRLGGWALLADGSIVYEQTQQHRRDYDFQDLFHWDRASGRHTRLTRGLRARDPSVSPDGHQVAFGLNAASRMRLAVMPLAPLPDGEEPRVLWEGGRWDQAYQPSWSPDGTRIAFSAWRQGGYRDIVVVDVASGAVQEVTRDRALDGDPAWSPDGATLFFSSDRTGIFNIYALEVATGALWQVTNVIGGAFDPSVSPDGGRLAYHGFDVAGYDLYEIALDRATWTVAGPYLDERPPPVAIPDDPSVVIDRRAYRPLETLGPDAWTAELATSSALGTAVTLRTGGSDAAGLHAWNLGATVSLDRGHVNLGGAYSYSELRLPLRLSGSRTVATRNGYRVDEVNQPYTEEVLSATLATGLPNRRSPLGSVSLGADLDFDYFHLVDVPDDVLDPGDAVPRPPRSNYRQVGVALRGSWSNVRGFAETIGPVDGHELSASLRLDHPVFGSQSQGLSTSWSYRLYQSLPWGGDGGAAVSARYAGGARVVDIDRGSAFSLGSGPDQDVIAAVTGTARVGTTGYLRGYEPRTAEGDRFHLLNLELRQRLWQIEHGLATLPIYFRRLHAAALLDAGTAYDGAVEDAEGKAGIGAALRLDLVLGWFASGTFEVGYARGLTDDGIDETWLLLTTTL